MISPIPENLILSVDGLARSRFSYKAEPGTRDQWRSHADAVLANKNWQGDCDDLASTALDLLMRQHPELPQTQLYRLIVKSPDCPVGAPYDHMVAGAMIRAGVLVLFGDTYAAPHLYVRSPHRIVRYAAVAEGVVWRDGHP